MLRINNLIGFGGGGLPVVPTDDGDNAPSSGEGGSAHTYGSLTSTGPVSVLLITFGNAAGGNPTLDTVTFDGDSMTELHEATRTTGEDTGCAIYIIDGAKSGDVVATWSGTMAASHLTIVSLDHLRDLTAIDVDDAGAASGTGTAMTALVGPGNNGIVLAVYANDTDFAGDVTWTNATEISDLDAGTHQHSAAWVIGNPAGDIIADGGNNDHQIIGVSLR